MYEVGDIKIIGHDVVSENWKICNGEVLNKNEYPVLFNLLGTTHGGGGDVFCLPDLRGRVAMGAGGAPGLTERILGYKVGLESLLTQEVAQGTGANTVINDLNIQPSTVLNFVIKVK